MMTESLSHIVIVGGGIGGLFAANALIAHGLRVSLFEQAPALGEVGAGVFLTPNSVRQLERVGLGPSVEKCGGRVGSGSQYFRQDGTPIAPVQVTDSSGWNATFGMHRADLVEMLAKALPADIVHTGHRCTGFAQTDDKASVSFANGAVVEADIVIAADGIHSDLRTRLWGESFGPHYTEQMVWRAVVPRRALRSARTSAVSPARPSATATTPIGLKTKPIRTTTAPTTTAAAPTTTVAAIITAAAGCLAIWIRMTWPVAITPMPCAAAWCRSITAWRRNTSSPPRSMIVRRRPGG